MKKRRKLGLAAGILFLISAAAGLTNNTNIILVIGLLGLGIGLIIGNNKIVGAIVAALALYDLYTAFSSPYPAGLIIESLAYALLAVLYLTEKRTLIIRLAASVAYALGSLIFWISAGLTTESSMVNSIFLIAGMIAVLPFALAAFAVENTCKKQN